MTKAFTLIEIIFAIVIISFLIGVGIVSFNRLKAHSVIESMSYTLTSGVHEAVELASSYMYLENNYTFKLGDILYISEKELVRGLKWNYTTSGSYNKDGTYSLRDETYSTPQVVLRITLDKSARVIKYRIDCLHLNTNTHKILRELCIKKWGDEDIQDEVSF